MNKITASIVGVIGVAIGLILGTIVWHNVAPAEEFSMKVEGNFGAAVTVTTTGHLPSDEQRINELTTGTGRILVSNQQVLLRATKFISTGYEWSQVADLPTMIATVATPNELGELAPIVIGRNEGSRIAFARVVHGQVIITVIDILPTRISGETSDATSQAGFTITEDDTGVPVVGALTKPVGEVKVIPLVTGDGSQLSKGDSVYANYVLAQADGTPIDNTFTEKKAPAYIAVNDVFPGLQAGLIDQRIGSRVLVVVPSAQAQGKGDVVIVVDILAQADEPTSHSAT